ncbi:MAG: IscS subfamily cysteine desulfurase [Ignavibacteria bacterium CG2_30_36_16]|nr:MAG: IscS subfamily cysteine desulfurase [Ignavibacteria bacterium CG2_30_36_16]
MMKVYLDNHSTTQVDPNVFEAMKPYFLEKYGNASSKAHSFGWEAESAVEYAKEMISSFLGCESDEIIFTSGATESINIAHFGAAQELYSKGNHIVTTVSEHSAVLGSLKLLEKKGFEITILPLNKEGLVDPDRLKDALTDKTILVSVMTANNVIGTVNDVYEIGKICKQRNIVFHTDATQAIGRLKLNFNEMNADMLSFSSHKIYGPKGVGVLIVKKKLNLAPIMYGGGQQKGLRPGTFNTPGIVGTGKAIEIFSEEMEAEINRLRTLRDKMLFDISANLESVKLNGSKQCRLPNNLNFCFSGVRSENIINELRDVALSSGSACASETLKPDRSLKAIGLSDEEAYSSIRIGIGRFNTLEEIDYASKRIIETVEKLRTQSPIKSN